MMNAAPYQKKLKRALDLMGGLFTVNDILERIAEGKMQSFVEGNSWAVTEIQAFPRRRVLTIVAALGDLEDLRILHDRVLQFAEAENCTLVRAFGRLGWMPDAHERGWRVVANNLVYHREFSR